MIFDSIVNNKVTEISVRRGDDVMTCTHEYDVEGLEEIVRDIESGLVFLGYDKDVLRDYYRELDEASELCDHE